jgi:NitT/TauT family transport system permease protein
MAEQALAQRGPDQRARGRALSPPKRPERSIQTGGLGTIGDVARPLTLVERIWQQTLVRRVVILVVLGIAWELYARYNNNPLLFPTLSETLEAWWEAMARGPLVDRTFTSLQVLLMGYAAGLALAAVFTTVAVSTRVGTDFLSTLTAMFNPLPAIALLPLALLWFGLGIKSLVFVIIHSVLWAVALNTHSGFMSVSPTLRMAGQNVGLRGLSYVAFLLVPAAFPSILTGLKIGWAFAWRTLIAAELVFGVSSRSGGLGWFIFENRNQLETASVFAGLFTVIIIGLVVESVIFRSIENATIRRWGMQS